MMISPKAIAAVRAIVTSDDFYRPSHAAIYQAALALHDAGDAVDAITLTGELERRGQLDQAGGRTRIAEISLIVPASANAGHYAELVHDAATLRHLIRLGGEIAQLGWNREGDPADLLEQARSMAVDVARRGTSAALTAEPWQTFASSATEAIPMLVDDLWPAGALGFVSAPPKKGKTWLGLSLALSVATGVRFLGRFEIPAARPVVYFALEGHRAAIRARIGCLARGLGIDPDDHQALANLHIVYKPAGLNLNEPRWVATVRDTTERLEADLVVVDVLRRAARLKENSNEEFADFLHQLDPLASTTSIALLHHFGKLNEIQKDRDAGERMAGAGAMYGALDVGIYITGSQDGSRNLRVEFDSRDLPAPAILGAKLVGDPSGHHGGFTYVDKAWWVSDHTTVIPEADVLAPAEEIAAFVRANGHEVERDLVAAHFQCSPDTIDRRLIALRELGVESIRGVGGRKTRLVAEPITERDDQLDLSSIEAALEDCTDEAAAEIRRLLEHRDTPPPLTRPSPQAPPHRTPPHAAMPEGGGANPLGKPETDPSPQAPQTSAPPSCGEEEPRDLQDKSIAASAAPLQGDAPPAEEGGDTPSKTTATTDRDDPVDTTEETTDGTDRNIFKRRSKSGGEG